MKNKPDNQETYKPKRDAKGRILPGFTGNPNGRPKGSTLKEYQAQKFREMSDEEKEIWLEEIDKAVRWRMAEGNPKEAVEHSGHIEDQRVPTEVEKKAAKAYRKVLEEHEQK
jgi:hypothetical protein